MFIFADYKLTWRFVTKQFFKKYRSVWTQSISAVYWHCNLITLKPCLRPDIVYIHSAVRHTYFDRSRISKNFVAKTEGAFW